MLPVTAGKVDLVLQGGGVKGIALAGAINALRATYPEIQRVAGTSAGAIVASFIAAGMSAQKLEETMRSLDYSNFQDSGWWGKHTAIGKGLEFVKKGGLFRTGYLHDWIATCLDSCGVRTWKDLAYSDDEADSGLTSNQRYRLVVIVSDISRGRMLRLPWDYQTLCDLDPNTQSVADAVTASACIPFYFQARQLVCGPAQGKEVLTLTDGGSLSNFPIGLFDRRDGRLNRWPTLGIRLSSRQTLAQGWGATDRPIEMFKRLFATMSNAHDSVYTDQPSVQARTIFVDTTGVDATDFTLTNDQRDRLFVNGQTAALSFLSAWDWDVWQRTYGVTL